MLTDFICCFQLFNRRKAALKHAMQLFSTRLTLIGHLIAALYLPQNLILAKHHGMISGSNLKQITGSSHACFQKQRNSHSQIEAMLFGQAGMLEEENDDHYYRLLQREYDFLRHKFGLSPMEDFVFKNLRTRPVNFPYLKVAQLATLWVRYDTLFSAILEARSTGEIKKYFRIPPSGYWETHYHFRYASPRKEKTIGENALNILLINTVVPMLFAYGLHNKRPEYCERATRLLESIPPEKNTIVTTFYNAGITVRHAGDSQALIQLKREYCEKKKCLYCRIGFRMLKTTIGQKSV